MPLANVRTKHVSSFSFANMEICRTQSLGDGLLQPHINGLENCLMETTSHIKMEFSFPFEEKRKKTSQAKFRAQTNSPTVVSSSETRRWERWEPDSEFRWDTDAELGVLQQLCFSAPTFLLSWPKQNLLPVSDCSAGVDCEMSFWVSSVLSWPLMGLKQC